MLFPEALEHLKSGIAVFRRGWEPQDGYLTLMPGMSHVWKIVLNPSPNAGNYIFSVEDLTVNDWEVYLVSNLKCGESVEVAQQDAA